MKVRMKMGPREADAKKVREVASDLTASLAATLRQLSPQIKAKHGIDGQILNLAIAQAATNTAAMAAMASVGAPLVDAQKLGEELDEVVHKAILGK